MRTFTHREKHFMYDPEALRVIQFNHNVDVLQTVRNAIDSLIEAGTTFQRVSATFHENNAGELSIEVKPV